MIHVYNRFAQILVYSFFICFSNAKESRSMTDEDIDNERRDQTINVLLFLCNMVASFALSPFEISNRMMSLPFLLTAGIYWWHVFRTSCRVSRDASLLCLVVFFGHHGHCTSLMVNLMYINRV